MGFRVAPRCARSCGASPSYMGPIEAADVGENREDPQHWTSHGGLHRAATQRPDLPLIARTNVPVSGRAVMVK